MSVDGTLGSLLQGVSQQPYAVRHEGTVSEQVNFNSDVVQGLTVRPALRETAVLLNQTVTDYSFLDIAINGTTYIFGFKPGAVALWDTAGNPQTIIAPLTGTDDPLDYIGYNMRPYVFGGKLFLANRDVTVAKGTVPDTSSAFGNCGIVYCLGGLFSRRYNIRLRYSNGDVCNGTYDTPDGTSTGDAAKTSAEHIMGQLRTSLMGHVNFNPNTLLALNGSVLGISHTTAFTLTATDDEDGNSLRSFTDRVDRAEHLSRTAYNGMTVRVTNADEGQEDDFYMRFNADDINGIGGGFGRTGVWEEWFNVNEVTEFDLSTMPHVIEKTGASEFTLKQGDWLSRRVGDETTNPFTDFVGHPVRDLGGFQSRLVIVAGPACCMSRTNHPFDFFKKSVLTDLSTDPVNITSTEEGAPRFDWIITFDRDLILLSDPGEGQYVITGNTKITPDTASMVKTTAFEINGGAKPVETGRTILFPFKSGTYSGIKEFFTNDEVTTNGADTVTETVDRYIVGLVDHMRCSTNFNFAVLKTDSPKHKNVVWVYKYLWQSTDKMQSSWGKWELPGTVRHFFFAGSELYFVLSVDGATPGTVDYVFAALDLDTPVDDVSEYHICLDRQLRRTADAASAITLPYSGAKFVQGTGCLTPGRQVHPVSETARSAAGFVTYSFDAETVPTGAELVCGLSYGRWVSPTMPVPRNREGRLIPRTRLVVNSFMLEHHETGYIKATMHAKYRSDPVEFISDWFAMDNDADDILGNGLRSGILDIPWGERADWSELTIFSDDVRPTTIIEVQWTGQVFKGSRQ